MSKGGLRELEAVSPQSSDTSPYKRACTRIKALPWIRGYGAEEWRTLNPLFLVQAPSRHVRRVDYYHPLVLSCFLAQVHNTDSPACNLLIPTSLVESFSSTYRIQQAMVGLLPAVALALLAVDVQAMKLDFLRFPRRALDSAEEHALSKRAPTYITNFTLPDTNYTCVISFRADSLPGPSIPLFHFEPFPPPLYLLVSPPPWAMYECRKNTLDVNQLTIRYIGCYTDTTAKRAFAHDLTDSIPGGAANMTVANCARAANVTGYVLFGIEYRYVRPLASRRELIDSQECWAGWSLDASSKLRSNASCSMPCKGNSSEYCGNGDYLQTYQLTSNITSIEYFKEAQPSTTTAAAP